MFKFLMTLSIFTDVSDWYASQNTELQGLLGTGESTTKLIMGAVTGLLVFFAYILIKKFVRWFRKGNRSYRRRYALVGLMMLLTAFAAVSTVTPTYALETTTTAYEGKNIAFLGDSITFGNGTTGESKIYTALVGDALNFDNVYNYGVSGSKIAKEDGATNSFLERYDDMEADLDVIVVYGGVNDFQTGDSLLGTETDAIDTTLYGNINLLMDGLQTTYPDAEIIFITNYEYDNTSFDSKIANATTSLDLADINAAIKNRAIAKHIDLIELEEFIGLDLYADSTAKTDYLADNLHLNDKGHEHLANLLISYLQRTTADYFNENMIDFTTITEGYELGSSGPYVNGATTYSFYSDYIEVREGYTYVAYSQLNEAGDARSNYVLFYDSDKAYVSMPTGELNDEIFTIPDGVKYIRINGSTISNRYDDTYVRELINYEVHKVSFDLGAYTIPDDVWVEDGTKISIADPVNSYNTFVGWYSDAALTTMFDTSNDLVTEDITLYAKWVVNSDTTPILDTSGFDLGDGLLSLGATALLVFGIMWFVNKRKNKNRRHRW